MKFAKTLLALAAIAEEKGQSDKLAGTVRAVEGQLAKAQTLAGQHQLEQGRKVRVDTTAVETNIHHPFESDQLWDVVRVLTRLMTQAKELAGN